jgi:hypothetical protein
MRQHCPQLSSARPSPPYTTSVPFSVCTVLSYCQLSFLCLPCCFWSLIFQIKIAWGQHGLELFLAPSTGESYVVKVKRSYVLFPVPRPKACYSVQWSSACPVPTLHRGQLCPLSLPHQGLAIPGTPRSFQSQQYLGTVLRVTSGTCPQMGRRTSLQPASRWDGDWRANPSKPCPNATLLQLPVLFHNFRCIHGRLGLRLTWRAGAHAGEQCCPWEQLYIQTLNRLGEAAVVTVVEEGGGRKLSI